MLKSKAYFFLRAILSASLAICPGCEFCVASSAWGRKRPKFTFSITVGTVFHTDTILGQSGKTGQHTKGKEQKRFVKVTKGDMECLKLLLAVLNLYNTEGLKLLLAVLNLYNTEGLKLLLAVLNLYNMEGLKLLLAVLNLYNMEYPLLSSWVGWAISSSSSFLLLKGMQSQS